jgi:hypothetical protein
MSSGKIASECCSVMDFCQVSNESHGSSTAQNCLTVRVSTDFTKDINSVVKSVNAIFMSIIINFLMILLYG